jgi:ABC-2 type transport system ATP-binding protein
MAQSAILTKKLTKYYGKNRGIEGVDLDVQDGEVFGFLGPNGAGKTTTIRTLLGLIKISSGSASIFGLDVVKNYLRIRERVAYLPGELGIYKEKSARRILKYLFAFYAKPIRWAKVEEIAEVLKLDLDRKSGVLSKGNKQKIGVILALAPDADLLILDEPTSGLDPLMSLEFFKLLVEKRGASGCTVLLSSHQLEEVEKVADRVGIIRNGRIAEIAAVTDLKRLALKHVELAFSDDGQAERVVDLVPHDLVESISVENHNHVHVMVTRANLSTLLSHLQGVPFEDIDIASPDLEDIFLKYYDVHDEPTRSGRDKSGRKPEMEANST